MTYLENLHETCISANKKALKERKGLAWDNRKVKTRKRYIPRGKFFKRFEKADQSRIGKGLVDDLDQSLEDLKHSVAVHGKLDEISAKIADIKGDLGV